MEERKVIILDKKTKVQEEVPYGLCLWATGVSPVPVTKTFMAAIPEQGQG